MGVAGCWGCAQGKQLTEGGRAGAVGLWKMRIGGDIPCCFLTVTTGLSRFSLLVLSIFAFYSFEAMFAKSFR